MSNKQFSWQKAIERATNCKIRRANTQAKAGHPDLKAKYPDEVRDAQQDRPNFTKQNIRVKDEVTKALKGNTDRITKRLKVKVITADGEEIQ